MELTGGLAAGGIELFVGASEPFVTFTDRLDIRMDLRHFLR